MYTVDIKVKVITKTVRNEIVGYEGDFLKIKIKAVREKGKANDALIAFLSTSLHIPKSSIEILQGHTSSLKRLRIKDYPYSELKIPNHPVVKDEV